MRSIGTLAGGIAHDFNNILMGIQGNVSLLLSQLDRESPIRANLEDIGRCVESGATLSARILGFAQGGKYQPAPADLNGLAQAGLEMFSRTRKDLDIHAHYAPDLPTVEVDRAQIEQVLLNLFVNAGQAMPGGGRLLVETAELQLDAQQAAAAGLAPGHFVQLTVRDTGCGVDPSVRERIFEPFFTTKERGRGTGLGLASAYGIVRHHGGTITVESSPGEGASFTIVLPASGKPVAPAVVRHADADAEAREGEGTVLLVDDEPMIATVGRGLLKHLGYQAFTASNGEEALAIFREHHGSIDAVLLDMVMPGLSGGKTFDRLREIDPGIGVLLTSGYSIDSEASEILSRGCDEFIQKPYNLSDFKRKLRRVVQRRRSRSGGSTPR
jgi:CheY-like chemotaxis protein